MPDETDDRGLSGWAGVALGQMWSEHDRSTGRTLSWFNRSRSQLPPNATPVVQSQIAALKAENAQLRAQLETVQLRLAGVERDYAELDAWADIAARKLKQHGL